ncbi:MAG TPA: hypothetical protein VEA60_01395 [Allosphingosinicella sp.]|nr:hypothetical protein [Allosphingosinicella sp.]
MRRPLLGEKQLKFVREVGSVVLGVLIALGIGEIAEAVRWKIRVDNSMAAVRVEMAGNRWNLAERVAIQPCMERRLEAIGAILAEARRTGVLPRIETAGTTAYRMIDTSAFEVSQSEGVPLHMDRAEARQVALLYDMSTGLYGELAEKEQESWRTLQLLEGPGGPVGGDLVTVLLQAWVNAKSQGRLIGIMALEGDRHMAEYGIPAILDDKETWTERDFRDRVAKVPICGPMIVDGKPMQSAAGP